MATQKSLKQSVLVQPIKTFREESERTIQSKEKKILIENLGGLGLGLVDESSLIRIIKEYLYHRYGTEIEDDIRINEGDIYLSIAPKTPIELKKINIFYQDRNGREVYYIGETPKRYSEKKRRNLFALKR